jgi:hypothetical protein
MKYRRLITFAGAAIIASSSPLLIGASAASAAAVPTVTITVGNCTASGNISENRDSNGAYVDMHLTSDPCSIGVEGAICSPDYTTCSFGGDVHHAGEDSVTGYIPINSGNHHGLRYWANNMWNYSWHD